MANPKLRFYFREPTIDTNIPITDGTVKIEGTGDADSILDKLLIEGKIDAVIGPNLLPSISARDPRTRRLFRDYRAEEQNYFRKTGIFPTSHIVTLKQEFVDRHPEAPVALLKAFRQSPDVAF